MFNTLALLNKQSYQYYFSKSYMLELAEKKINHSTAFGSDNMNYNYFKKHIDSIIEDIIEKVSTDRYVFSDYKELLIIKNKYSFPRCISIPTIRDRLCLQCLNEFLKHEFIEIDKQKLPQSHVKRVQNNINFYDSYIKIDISNFFDSIDHNLLMNKIINQKINPVISNLILKSIKNSTAGEKSEEGLPQGIPISNILSHLFLSDFDSKYKSMENIMYCRYVDDILIFCRDSERDTLKETIINELKNEYKLLINEQKTIDGSLDKLTRHNPLIYLGYTFFRSDKNSKYITSVRIETKRLIEQKIISIFNRFKNDKGSKNARVILYDLNRLITGSFSRKIDSNEEKIKRFGWLFFYSQISDESLLWHLDSFINKQIHLLIKNNPNLDIYIQNQLKNRKRFVTSFYEIKYNFDNTTYILNPDNLSTVNQRIFLSDIMSISDGEIRKMTDEEVDKRYKNFVYRKIKKEQKDLIESINKSF